MAAPQQDWNALSDAEFRQIFRAWVDENCPQELRFMRKQRPVYEEVKDWYQTLAEKGGYRHSGHRNMAVWG